MLDITKCFSILIASGNGQRCNNLRILLRDKMYQIDEDTGKNKIVIMKYGKKSEPEAHNRISRDVATQITPLFSDVNDYFFSIDLPKERQK